MKKNNIEEIFSEIIKKIPHWFGNRAIIVLRVKKNGEVKLLQISSDAKESDTKQLERSEITDEDQIFERKRTRYIG